MACFATSCASGNPTFRLRFAYHTMLLKVVSMVQLATQSPFASPREQSACTNSLQSRPRTNKSFTQNFTLPPLSPHAQGVTVPQLRLNPGIRRPSFHHQPLRDGLERGLLPCRPSTLKTKTVNFVPPQSDRLVGEPVAHLTHSITFVSSTFGAPLTPATLPSHDLPDCARMTIRTLRSSRL
jgi:hypothetical protein